MEDLAKVNPFLHHETEKNELIFQHFAYVTPEQLDFKESYYGYKNALQEWKRLREQTEFPILLKNYLSWVTDETIAEPANTCGVAPLMEKDITCQYWRFLSSQEIQQKTMDVRKPFPQIVIDGVFFQFADSGIAQVWRNLLKCWSENGFYQHLIVLDRAGTAPRITNIRYRPVPAYDYNQTDIDAQMLQKICDEKKADLFISTYYTTPLSTPSVFLAHDMIPEVIGANLEELCWKEKHYGIMHASSYLAISQNTARDLNHFFPHISLNKITIANCGIKSIFSPSKEQDINQFKTKYNIKKPYLLLVGERIGLNGYKNAIYLFRALSKLVDTQKFAIFCVGGKPELEPELAALAERVETFITPLTDEELKVAYSAALAYIYPSKYEGFGLPILEAMACGCPVITSRNSSLSEVGGEAAYYLDELNECELIQALYNIQNIEIRQHLIDAGFAQTKHFAWSNMANTIADVFFETSEKIKTGEITTASPIWKALRKQQSLLKTSNSLLEKIKQELNFTNALVKQYKGELEQCRQQSQSYISNVDDIADLKELLNIAQTEIKSMKTSKFWKLRTKWFRFKQKLGLPLDKD